MKIGELASQARCEVQTIRFYEREGLLEAPARDPSGYRRYAGQHLQRLQFIRHCRSLDMPLAEIRHLLAFAAEPEQSCAQVNALVDEHLAAVRQRIKALKLLEQQLVALRAQCDGETSQPCAILESFMTATGVARLDPSILRQHHADAERL
jgi:Cd(II)/Pb(II)-responsive transcriptional regulator